jgi:deoxyribodipyrimidine photo-lyase
MRNIAVWFRNDLRVDDHPALAASADTANVRVIAVCVIAKKQWQLHGVGENFQALYFSALRHLTHQLAQRNIELDLLEVDTWQQVPEALTDWVQQNAIEQLHFNVEIPFDERQRDLAVYKALSPLCNVVRHSPDMLCEPWRIQTQQGLAFKVFTPFCRRVESILEQEGLTLLPAPPAVMDSQIEAGRALSKIESIEVRSRLKVPDVSPDAITRQVAEFFHEGLRDYSKCRDFPALKGTSQLSPALAVGAVSVRRLYQDAIDIAGEAARKWTSELIWRDFYRYIMWHYPHVSKGFAFRKEIEPFIQWNQDEQAFLRWCKGETGVPIVDAAMRQLNQTGWMHNRLRMVVASFLTKNLWLDWRRGEAYFASQLFDYDYASNNGGWQWSASVGTDAAPYFRVFSPTSQAERFDPDADFIRYWIPELSHCSAKQIHRYEALELPNYLPPMVDLKFSRRLAIEHFKQAMMAAEKNPENY